MLEDSGVLEVQVFRAWSASESGTTRSTSSRHGLSICDGVDAVIRSVLHVLEFTCANALVEEKRSVATHRQQGNGEKVQLSIAR
jgi:hypothetical protein